MHTPNKYMKGAQNTTKRPPITALMPNFMYRIPNVMITWNKAKRFLITDINMSILLNAQDKEKHLHAYTCINQVPEDYNRST